MTFTDGGQLSYNPNTTSLTIQTGPQAAVGQFTQNITAPGGNNPFQASPQVAAVANTTPIPASWLSFNPSPLNFSTGPAQNPKPDTKSWVVTATVPANSTPGTYVADIQAKPNSANVQVAVGQGTRLTLNVLPPAPVDDTPPPSSLAAQDSNGNPYNGVDYTNANKVTITTPADGGSYLFNSSVAANFSTSDALSGLDPNTLFSTTPPGSSVNTASVGQKSFNVSVTDKEGNAAGKTSTL